MIVSPRPRPAETAGREGGREGGQRVEGRGWEGGEWRGKTPLFAEDDGTATTGGRWCAQGHTKPLTDG